MVGDGQEVFREQSRPDLPTLTEREREILALIAIGATNREIAAELYLSPHTVKEHTSSLYRKLGARNRADAVQRAQRFGHLDLSGAPEGALQPPGRGEGRATRPPARARALRLQRMVRIAGLFPGQGSQTPDMREHVERAAPELLERCIELIGEDPFARVSESTRFAQPAIFCASVAGWMRTRERLAPPPARRRADRVRGPFAR